MIQVLLLPVAFLAAEFLYRGWSAASDATYSAAIARTAMMRIADQMNQAVGEYAPRAAEDGAVDDERFQHPFFAWDHPSSQRRLTETTEYFAQERSERLYDIVIVGGSVAHGFGGSGRRRLVELLQRDPRLAGRGIRVHAWAFGGAKQPQQLNQVAYLLNAGWKPEAVINLDGFNEVALSANNAALGAHPNHPSAPHWAHTTSKAVTREQLDLQLDMREHQRRARGLVEWALRWQLHRSALSGGVVLSRLQRLRRDYSRLHTSYSAAVAEASRGRGELGPTFQGTLEEAVDLAVRTWAESSRSLQAICDARGIVYVHALQPTMYDDGSKTLTPEEVAVGAGMESQVNGVRYGYPRLRAAGRELVAVGVGFVDTSMVFQSVGHTLYIDLCHFIPEGQEILAEPIAEALLAGLP